MNSEFESIYQSIRRSSTYSLMLFRCIVFTLLACQLPTMDIIDRKNMYQNVRETVLDVSEY